MPRYLPLTGTIVALALASSLGAAQAPTGAPPTFHPFFLGHEIGAEVDTVTPTPDGHRMTAAFHYQDRATNLDLAATLDIGAGGSPTHFVTKGRNYRLFTSDAEGR